VGISWNAPLCDCAGALAASVIDALFARDAVLQIESNDVIGKKARHKC
jgi:hypothetical protein